MKQLVLIISYLLIQISNTVAGTIHGTQGPVYLTPAWNLLKGDLLLHGYSRFYFKNEVIKNHGQPPYAVTFWDAQGTFNIFYGLGKYYEIGLAQIVYQDNHKQGKGYNLPDDLYLKVKFASFGPKTSPFNFGVQICSRIPTAKYHNVPLEPYSAGRLEYSINGLASFSSNLLFPEDSFNAHINLGYLDHNDVGQNLAGSNQNQYVKSTSSKEFIYGLGFVYPILKFDFSLEFYGNRYLSRPTPSAYSRYNYAYITPGITYHPYYWLSVIFGFDYRLTTSKPNEKAKTISTDLPVFPTWRVNFGLKINLISKLQNRYEEKDKTNFINEKKQDKNVYQKIAEERKEVENAEKELESIKQERKRMDEMLKRLRNILELKEAEKKKPEEN